MGIMRRRCLRNKLEGLWGILGEPDDIKENHKGTGVFVTKREGLVGLTYIEEGGSGAHRHDSVNI